MSFDPRPAAEALIARRDASQPAGPLPAAIAPRDGHEAALVQFAVWALRGGHAIGGFKIGATGARMQRFLDIDHPCAGYMARADLHESGAVLPFASLRDVSVECELAVRLAADLPPGPCTPEQAGAAVGELFAAIEIVENRYGPPPIGDVKAVGTPTLIADQFYHAAAVLGAPGPDWRALDLVAIEGRALVDGVERNAGRGGELLGHPLRGLAWLAASPVAAAFGGLRAGHVVMLGSVVPPIPLAAPCRVEIRFDGLAPVLLRFAGSIARASNG
jgi:2-keto-4-pentenoate hydratase